jgi:hypothetical protein
MPAPVATPGLSDAAQAGPASERAPARRRFAMARLSLWALAVPALLGATRLALSLGQPFAHAGDQAVLELGVRRAVRGAQLLGPYSRFGFSQPGPAYFYAQAPFYWLSGGSPRALFLGAFLINLGSAAASVVVVRRFLGEDAARWTAAVVGAFLVLLSPALLNDPWNPYVLILPLLLTVVLAAGAAAGSLASLAGALFAGSFVVQTHLGAGMAVAAVVGTGAGLWALGRRRATGPATRRGRALAGAAGAALVLGLVWFPPLLEQARGGPSRPGNLTKVARFFGRDHPEADQGVDHSLATATGDLSTQLTLLPLGRHLGPGPVPAGRVAAAGAGLAGGIVLAVGGWRRRRPFVVGLGLASVAGTAAGLWSTTRIVGTVNPYLLVWASALAVPVWIGAGLLGAEAVFMRARSMRARTARVAPGLRGLPGLLALAVLLPSALLSWSLIRGPLTPVATAISVIDVTALVRPWLGGAQAQQVEVRHVDAQWPLAAGLVVQLQKDGFGVSVDDQWTPLYGEQLRSLRNEDTVLWLGAQGGGAPPGAVGVERLGEAGGASVWGIRLPPATNR